MTLKEQLEILRGEPIQLKAPIEEIPCIETSDAEKLCKHPVVSVNMITYNHEPYIRQAIEGVMMQKTDFEFELVIGEDASQDKTREICFEYQKKYPDKIRVLWSEHNVNHLGGNGRRVRARSRGEFIALCEGDDYWTDPLKLQKQVDIMRAHPDVGLCFCGAIISNEMTGEEKKWNSGSFPIGKMEGKTFANLHIFGAREKKDAGSETFIMTATTLFRKSIYDCAVVRYEIFNWRLFLGDTTLWVGLSLLSNVYFLKDKVSIYRRNQSSSCSLFGGKVVRDANLVRLFYSIVEQKRMREDFFELNAQSFFCQMVLNQTKLTRTEQKKQYQLILHDKCLSRQMKRFKNIWIRIIWKFGLFSPKMYLFLGRYFYFRTDTIRKLKASYRAKQGQLK